jgi:hypothetical protein
MSISLPYSVSLYIVNSRRQSRILWQERCARIVSIYPIQPSKLREIPESPLRIIAHKTRSHQLLSLHSTPHPAILIAHLRLGSYYVLKDTGQMIGDEAGQGVVELWQGILGCTARAEVDRDVAGRFWNGWEGRVREKLEQRFD